MTLKKDDDGYVLDLTSMRAHKTARFYGPSITSMSSLLAGPLDDLIRLEQLDDVGGDAHPYLFHPNDSTGRAVPSS
eukprot:4612800-Prymnesium_polylepis.1